MLAVEILRWREGAEDVEVAVADSPAAKAAIVAGARYWREGYRVIRPWLTSTFDELIVYCRTTLLLSKKITSDFLSPSEPL